MRIVKILEILFFGAFLLACNRDYDFNYDIIVSDTPTNLNGLNSGGDDYNSDLPYPAYRTDITFSSNRGNNQNDFDFVSGIMDVSYHEKDDVLNITVPTNDISRKWPNDFYQKVNTNFNEFGPYSYHLDNDVLFMYSSEEENHKIKLVNIINANRSGTQIGEPIVLPVINEVGDNMYPSKGVVSDELLFCSNRDDSVFNMMSIKYNAPISARVLEAGDVDSIEKETVLSSAYNDKCPSLTDDVLVFASNRPGGFGGYDLWYSRHDGNGWSVPENFGEKINTAYDEFRPVRIDLFGQDVMVFSSNRPNGKGGFDLYVVKAGLVPSKGVYY